MANFDLITGTAPLPHVYCKKIVLERNANQPDTTDVTLKLELRVKKKDILDTWWLKDQTASVNNQTFSLLDGMFIQVVTLNNPSNINKLKPTYLPLQGGNIHTAETHGGFNALTNPLIMPRGSISNDFPIIGGNYFSSDSIVFKPIQISRDSLLGNLSNVLLADYISEGKVREEYLPPTNELYCIIPFDFLIPQMKPANDPTAPPIGFFDSQIHSLGFCFYTFFHMPYLLSEFPGTELIPEDFIEMGVARGSISSEIAIHNGKLQQTREQFIIPGGTMWNGSVHLHGPDNPAPGNYYGNGGLGLNKGWMAGQKHNMPNLEQPKLILTEVPNYKVQDWRPHGKVRPESILGPNYGKVASLAGMWKYLGGATISPTSDGPPGSKQYEVSTPAFRGSISAMQRENKKYFLPADSDSEFSKLYLTRGSKGDAKGLFSINFRNWLANNSVLYKKLFTSGYNQDASSMSYDSSKYGASRDAIESHYMPEVLKYVEISELKVYRERIKEHNLGSRTEKYKNGESDEDPSELIQTIADIDGYGSAPPKPYLREIRLKDPSSEAQAATPPYNFSTRYFTFSDPGDEDAGLYQYRVEVKIKDGTYMFLNELLNKLLKAQRLLKVYLHLAMSYDPKDKKAYFQNGSFTDDFQSVAYAELVEKVALHVAPSWIQSQLHSLGIIPGGSQVVSPAVLSWIQEAAAAGIEYKNPILSYIKDHAAGQVLLDAAIADSFVKYPIWQYAPYLIADIRNIFGLGLPAVDVGAAGVEVHPDPTTLTLLDPHHGSLEGIEFAIKTINSAIRKIKDLTGATKQKPGGGTLTRTNSATLNMVFNSAYDYKISSTKALVEEKHTFDHPKSLLRQSPNKDVYLDYLSAQKSPQSKSTTGLRVLKASQYKNRCKAELSRFYNQDISMFDGGGTQGDSSDLSPLSSEYIPASATGYTYLAPSIIRMHPRWTSAKASTGAGQHQAGRYEQISIFGSSVETPPDINLLQFANFTAYSQIYAAMANYTYNKGSVDNAVFSTPFQNLTSIAVDSAALYQRRELYKNLATNIGLTLHGGQAMHDEWFDRQPGALPLGTAAAPGDTYPLAPDSSSDAHLSVDFYIKQLASHDGSPIELNSGKTHSLPGVKNKPNSYKIVDLYNTPNWDYKNNINALLKAALDSPAAGNAFLFFNFNMTRKIQVYRPQDFNHAPVDDSMSWIRLTRQHLDRIASSQNSEYLLCRIKHSTSPLTAGIDVPVLDEYFLIAPDLPQADTYSAPFQNFPIEGLSLPGLDKFSVWDLDSLNKQDLQKRMKRDSAVTKEQLNKRKQDLALAGDEMYNMRTSETQQLRTSARGSGDPRRASGGQRARNTRRTQRAAAAEKRSSRTTRKPKAPGKSSGY